MHSTLKVLLVIAIISSSKIALSAPAITSATVSGGSVSVSGSGFGTKSPAAPILFENFDSGTNGQGIGGWHNWVNYNGINGGYLSNTSPYSGTLSAYNRITGPNATNPISWQDSEFNTSYFSFSATDEIYYSYVAKFVSTGNSAGVIKWVRVTCAPNVYNGPGAADFQISYFSFNTGTDSDPDNDDDGKSPWGFSLRGSDWMRHEMYKKLSTPGVANGMVQGRAGTESRTWTNIITREAGFSFQHTSVLLGLMYANTETDGDHRMYVDDVYVDNTRARVELCTGSEWSNRGTCNPQPPTVWSASSISATANTATFSEGATVYAYVVDSDGSYNSSGYGVTIGGSGAVVGGKMSGGGKISSGGYMR